MAGNPRSNGHVIWNHESLFFCRVESESLDRERPNAWFCLDITRCQEAGNVQCNIMALLVLDGEAVCPVSPPNKLINLRGFVNWHLPMFVSGSICSPVVQVSKTEAPVMNSFTIPLQSHWSDCQYCTYSNSGSRTGLYWHWVMEQTHYVFAIWPVIYTRHFRFVYFIVCTVEALFYHSPAFSCSAQHCNFVLLHTPLPFISPNASSCAWRRWLGSKAGWITMMVSVLSWVPVPPQSKPPFPLPLFCVWFPLSPWTPCLAFFFLLLLYKPPLLCLFSYLPHCFCLHCFWRGQTLNPDFCFLYSPIPFLWPPKPTSASRFYCSG